MHHRVQAGLGITGNGLRDVAEFRAALLDACVQGFDLRRVNKDEYRLQLYSLRSYEQTGDNLRSAWFEFPSTGTRMLHGRIGATHHSEADSGRESWTSRTRAGGCRDAAPHDASAYLETRKHLAVPEKVLKACQGSVEIITLNRPDQ
jgi:hypothetical protein